MPLTNIHDASSAGRKRKGALIQILGRSILTGEYKPGDTLPGEISYSAALGVSRTAYREAVQGLVAKGLVEARRKIGTYVLPRHRWSVLDQEVLAWGLAGGANMGLLQSLSELRAANEPFAAGVAALRHDEADLRLLEEAVGRISHCTLSTSVGQAAVGKFHQTILSASKNDAFISLTPAILVAIEWRSRIERSSYIVPCDPAPKYMRVYEAVAGRKADEASEAMRDLVDLRGS